MGVDYLLLEVATLIGICLFCFLSENKSIGGFQNEYARFKLTLR